ncbi:MAG TPA: hypothetical protein VGJ28_27025 [Micromonosporaceae bacterium]|jgi:hypothetical protein
MTEEIAWVPDSCTLPTVERPVRRAEFDDVFALTRSIERPNERSARFRLTGRPGLAPLLSDLAARESECCSFFTFAVNPLPSGDVDFDIAVPAAHVDVLDALVARAGQHA